MEQRHRDAIEVHPIHPESLTLTPFNDEPVTLVQSLGDGVVGTDDQFDPRQSSRPGCIDCCF